MIIPILGWIAVPVFWRVAGYDVALRAAADRRPGLTFGEAARASSQMVKGVGWWKTFGTIVVLGAAFFVVTLVISLIGRASSTFSSLLHLVFEIAAGPFAICYVSTMYLGSGGEAVPCAGAGWRYGAPAGSPGLRRRPVRRAACGWPDVSACRPAARHAAVGAVTGSHDGRHCRRPATPPRADADAWKAAADPLAARSRAGGASPPSARGPGEPKA